jgi:hypothetical protein
MSTWAAAKENWIAGNLVLATDMNLIGNDLNWLKAPPTANYVLNQGSDYTTTSSSFVNVDGTNLSLAITTAGGNVLIGFSGVVGNNTLAAVVYLDVDIDGAGRFAGDDGIVAIQHSVAGHMYNASFVVLKTGLVAGLHTFKLQWKVQAGTGTLYAGAGTAQHDNHAQFWVREV